MFNACVARPVAKKEPDANPLAKKAVQIEWDKLRALPGGGAWDETCARPLREVMAEADRNKRLYGVEDVHWGYIFDICFEKNTELPAGHKLRKF